MQNYKIFRHLSIFFQIFLVFCFIVALFQNYVYEGTVYIFGVKFTQFYKHVDVRVVPLLFIAVFKVKGLKKALGLNQNLYLSEMLISFLTAFDAFAHITGLYNASFYLGFYERFWFDKVTHFIEGVILMIACYPIFYRFVSNSKGFIKSKKLWSYWLSISYISVFFIIWEIIELIIDKARHMQLLIRSTYDTNEDLAFAYIGIILSIIILELYFLIARKVRKQIHSSVRSISE